MEFTPNPETDALSRSELKPASSSIKYLLDTQGEPGEEYGVSKILTYHNTALESYRLTQDEAEYEEYYQQITIRSVAFDTDNYLKGLYVDIWTNITPDEIENSDTTCWRFTRYGLPANNRFFVSDEFQIVVDQADGQNVTGSKATILREKIHGVSGKRRFKEMQKIEEGLSSPGLTSRDYIELTRVLAEFNPANIIHP